ncbi:hypothetical protein AAFF_G00057770 [Aldrovandia affinis]|uniref:Uncharacterized protein n=1 Tax=Aldrovandia affinis TaxID=143900 RepID=A0AAD7S0J7_9TELE|nr:hypothetical protein AAFF_G00057770 [Aldrovandia affinis]
MQHFDRRLLNRRDDRCVPLRVYDHVVDSSRERVNGAHAGTGVGDLINELSGGGSQDRAGMGQDGGGAEEATRLIYGMDHFSSPS